MTPAERAFAKATRGKKLGFRIRRQTPIGPYFADFLAAKARVVIELDGGYHFNRETYDRRRTRFMESRGFRVLRFTNDEVLTNLESVLEAVMRYAI